MFIHKDN